MTLLVVEGHHMYKVTLRVDAPGGVSLGEIVGALENAGFDVRQAGMEEEE